MRILFTGGGSGGHIIPLIAVVQEIKKHAHEQGMFNIEFVFIGPTIKNTLWEGLLKKEGIKVINITAGKIRRYFSFQNIVDIAFKIPASFVQALWYVFWNMPNVVFSKGGYGSVPVVLISRFYRIPVVIHESDAVVGLGNKSVLRYVQCITCGFEETLEQLPKGKSFYVGNPIRQTLLDGSKEMGRQVFSLRHSKPVLLIIGGSQGSEFLNDTILNNLEDLMEEFEIIHITGQKNFEGLSKELEARFGRLDFIGYHPYPFLTDDLKEAYAVTDVVIARASASVIAELSATGKPSILIPLPGSAQDHQKANAYLYGRAGAAVVIEEDNVQFNVLLRDLLEILNNKALHSSMVLAAKNFNPINASEIIAQKIFQYL